MDYIISILLILSQSFSGVFSMTSIEPLSDTYIFTEGESIKMTWSWKNPSGDQFISIECGQVDVALPINQDNMETLVTLKNDKPEIITKQPNEQFAIIKGSQDSSRKTISMEFLEIKKKATGEYKCVLKTFANALGKVVKVESKHARLTTVDVAAIESEKKKDRNIIIGVLVGGVGIIIIITILACLMYRRSKGRSNRPVWTCAKPPKKKNNKSADKKNGKQKKVTKKDIQRRTSVDDEDENLNQVEPGETFSKRNSEPKYAKVEIVSTPEEALNRPYYDGDSDMKEFV